MARAFAWDPPWSASRKSPVLWGDGWAWKTSVASFLGCRQRSVRGLRLVERCERRRLVDAVGVNPPAPLLVRLALLELLCQSRVERPFSDSIQRHGASKTCSRPRDGQVDPTPLRQPARFVLPWGTAPLLHVRHHYLRDRQVKVAARDRHRWAIAGSSTRRARWKANAATPSGTSPRQRTSGPTADSRIERHPGTAGRVGLAPRGPCGCGGTVGGTVAACGSGPLWAAGTNIPPVRSRMVAWAGSGGLEGGLATGGQCRGEVGIGPRRRDSGEERSLRRRSGGSARRPGGREAEVVEDVVHDTRVFYERDDLAR